MVVGKCYDIRFLFKKLMACLYKGYFMHHCFGCWQRKWSQSDNLRAFFTLAWKVYTCIYSLGDTPRKIIGWWCMARLPKPLPSLWPKSAIFHTLSLTWPKISCPIYDCCSWHGCQNKIYKGLWLMILSSSEAGVSSSQHDHHTHHSMITFLNNPQLKPMFMKWPACG